MPKIFPAPFRIREWILTALAIAFGTTTLLLSNAAGIGTGGILFLSSIVGTLLFVAIAGRHRTFFTAVFTSTMSGGLIVWSVVDSAFIRRESLSADQFLLPFILAFFYVLLPVVFARMVTFVICRLEKVFRNDDRAT